MIYNENGYILTESITVGKTVIVLPSDYILEAYSDDEDKKVKELKDLLKECDNESIDKIKSIDKKYKYVTERVRKLLKVLSGVSAGVGTVGLIGGILSKSNKVSGIFVSLILIFYPLFIILDNIVNKSDDNKYENRKEFFKIVDEVINKLNIIKNNNKLPKEIRNKAEENIEKIQNKFKEIDNRTPNSDKLKEKVYIDFKINNIPIELYIDEEVYNKHKSFYIKALNSFKSNFNSDIKRIRKEMRDFGDGYEEFADNPIEWMGLSDNPISSIIFDSDDIYSDDDGKCAALNIQFKDSSSGCFITMIYTKTDGYYGCWWSYVN